MTVTTRTPQLKAATISAMLATIQHCAVPRVVVDYGVSWRKIGATGRFGCRDLNHVEIYGLTVVALNNAAKRLK